MFMQRSVIRSSSVLAALLCALAVGGAQEPLLRTVAAVPGLAGVDARAGESRIRVLTLERAGAGFLARVLGESAPRVEVLGFLPRRSHLVRGDPALLEGLVARPGVVAVRPLPPSRRLDPVLATATLRGRLELEAWLGRASAAEKSGFARELAALDGRLLGSRRDGGRRVAFDLDARSLPELLLSDRALFVGPRRALEADVDQARILGGAAHLEFVEGYTGAGVRGQVRDFGLDLGHPEVLARPPLLHGGTAGPTAHGTSVWGIVFASGAGNPLARGMLPDGQAVFTSESTTVDRYAETGELLLDPWRCVFETNSVGSPVVPVYDLASAGMDEIVFDHDLAICQSMGNTGAATARPEAWAKNLISVGGIAHGGTADPSDDVWGGISSTGPAADGRTKPDLVSFADGVLAPAPFVGYLPNFGGTSAATPIVAGHLGLFHQLWADGLLGNPLVSWDVFENRPSAALSKAVMIATARPYAFAGPGSDLDRSRQGHGHPDLQRLHDLRDRFVHVDESAALVQGQGHALALEVPPGEAALLACLTWSDPPAQPAAALQRVNDLSLTAVAPSGTVWRGNVGLELGVWSQPGGAADTADTVEVLRIPTPEAGVWTLTVSADEVNEDGRPETLPVDVDFALAVLGVLPPPPPAPDLGQANRAEASLAVVDAVNLRGRKPVLGEPGPFFVERAPGELLEFLVEGPAQAPFLLLHGPLGRANACLAPAGQLDLGLLGPGDLGDVEVLLDGIAPAGLLDVLARTDAAGGQRIALALPLLPPGSLGAFQVATYDAALPAAWLSAATEVVVP